MIDDPRTVQMDVVDLEIGMYISELDRPWIDTPFLVEGFYIESQDEIDRLHELCKYVFVDVRRSRKSKHLRTGRILGHHHELKQRQQLHGATDSGHNPLTATFSSAGKPKDHFLFSTRRLKQYEDTSTVEAEMGPARKAYNTLLKHMIDCQQTLANRGALDLSWVRPAIEALVASITRNPDAAVWYARIKDEKSYGPRHCVSTAIWAAAFGRSLGLPMQELSRLATGGLLLDIGKFGLPEELLSKQGKLDVTEFQHIQTHVQIGLVMVKHSGLSNRTVTEMIETHHERYAGQGYPKGLAGDDIPLYGRIAAIVDCYDAITSKRVYAPAMSPSDAIKRLYAWRDQDFDGSLVESFIQAIGLYPAGTLVELNDGRVGVVLSGYRQNKLRPTLLLLLDQNKQALANPSRIDLATTAEHCNGEPLAIASSLAPGSYGLDQEKL